MSQHETKTVLFFGNELTIPAHHYYVACDCSGDIYSYIYRPEFPEEEDFWVTSQPEEPTFIKNIGEVKFNKAKKMMECYHVR
jgi:hypothetical protein|nr:MAG TPA: hypothetical protein [Caudoviricetes sp.]DAX23377.1 MAG TPA: hypothetical protein [Caudoviricetes sp.]